VFFSEKGALMKVCSDSRMKGRPLVWRLTVGLLVVSATALVAIPGADAAVAIPSPVKVPQSIVGRQLEPLCGVIALADDVFAVGVEPNHFEFPHGISSQAPCRSARTC